MKSINQTMDKESYTNWVWVQNGKEANHKKEEKEWIH